MKLNILISLFFEQMARFLIYNSIAIFIIYDYLKSSKFHAMYYKCASNKAISIHIKMVGEYPDKYAENKAKIK